MTQERTARRDDAREDALGVIRRAVAEHRIVRFFLLLSYFFKDVQVPFGRGRLGVSPKHAQVLSPGFIHRFLDRIVERRFDPCWRSW